MLVIAHVDVRRIRCICSACLSKLDSPCNISRDKYNQDQYKVENKNCVHWPIIGYYNQCQIINFIDSR